MIIVKTLQDLTRTLRRFRDKNQTIGFVPTMGALHQGHISLVEKARLDCDICVVSIFVNPTQFNNPEDFKKYPTSIESDLDLLEETGCHLLFLPDVAEIYPVSDNSEKYELGYLETILEGEYRPGHFQGVCQVVDKLLAAVEPDDLFLGSKDYQQCMVIKKLTELKSHPAKLHFCPTVRENDGLAMSSRNRRLNSNQRDKAAHIYKILSFIRDNIKPGYIDDYKLRGKQLLEENGFKVDYVEIAKAENLEIMHEWDGKTELVILIAAYLDDIRLIDNMKV